MSGPLPISRAQDRQDGEIKRGRGQRLGDDEASQSVRDCTVLYGGEEAMILRGGGGVLCWESGTGTVVPGVRQRTIAQADPWSWSAEWMECTHHHHHHPWGQTARVACSFPPSSPSPSPGVSSPPPIRRRAPCKTRKLPLWLALSPIPHPQSPPRKPTSFAKTSSKSLATPILPPPELALPPLHSISALQSSHGHHHCLTLQLLRVAAKSLLRIDRHPSIHRLMSRT